MGKSGEAFLEMQEEELLETIIKTTTISELKSLVREVKELQDCKVAFGLLYEQEKRLNDMQKRINQLIITL